MPLRLNGGRMILKQLGDGLKSFQSSNSTFKVLATIVPSTREVIEPQSLPASEAPKTLFILDSSFNPPSIAHQSLAERAIQDGEKEHRPRPWRLLLLFSTMNADKAASPASFDQRLAMMAVFAQDLLAKLEAENESAVPIDIGLTTAPYYTDKSRAIETEGRDLYSSQPKHVHLLGFDTLTRVFTAKYYAKFKPPFSALDPYFDNGHEMRATLRPDNDYGTIEQQQELLEKLGHGQFEADGGKAEWAKQVQLVPPNPKTGVSSTKIRNAAKANDFETVEELCTPSVAGWLQSNKLYHD